MITYRNATKEGVATILDWAAEEGWNPGLDDATAFYAADPDGFFVAYVDGEGPVAAISVVNHSADYAFLGLYIVRPTYRGRGIGYGLWKHSMGHAGNRTVGLDGVEEQQQNYARSGFVHAGGTTRFTGRIRGAPDPAIRTTPPDAAADLVLREAAVSGVAKFAYLSAWFADTPTRTTYIIESEAGLGGFMTLRGCQTGAKIGPLYADSSANARRLIRHAAYLTQGPVIVDVPESAQELRRVCEDLGLEAGFKTARMYRGAAPAQAEAIFAPTTLELG